MSRGSLLIGRISFLPRDSHGHTSPHPRCFGRFALVAVRRLPISARTTSTLDNPEDYPPTEEVWLSDKLAWENTRKEIPLYLEDSPG